MIININKPKHEKKKFFYRYYMGDEKNCAKELSLFATQPKLSNP